MFEVVPIWQCFKGNRKAKILATVRGLSPDLVYVLDLDLDLAADQHLVSLLSFSVLAMSLLSSCPMASLMMSSCSSIPLMLEVTWGPLLLEARWTGVDSGFSKASLNSWEASCELKCAFNSIQYAVRSMHYVLFILQCAVCIMEFAVWSVECTLLSMEFTTVSKIFSYYGHCDV